MCRCYGVRSRQNMFVRVCVCMQVDVLDVCLSVFEHPPTPRTRVTLADKPQGGGLWLRAAVMDRARLEARPNGLHSRQKLVTTCLSLNTPQLCCYFLHCEMSNGSGKSAKYSLSIWGFNYLLTQEGFVKKKKRKEKKKNSVWISEESSGKKRFVPDMSNDVYLYHIFSQSLSIWDVTELLGSISSQQSLLN